MTIDEMDDSWNYQNLQNDESWGYSLGLEQGEQAAATAAAPYTWITKVENGQAVQDAVPLPAMADITQLARLGLDIAKVYQAANGSQVRYIPVQTANGIQYQRNMTPGSILNDPMMLALLAGGAFLLMKG